MKLVKLYYPFVYIISLSIIACEPSVMKSPVIIADTTATAPWQAPDTNTIPNDAYGAQVKYGRDLILNTAYYIGPEGTKGNYLGNKMNCTNCHLKAGTQPYGLNYFSAHARYPQYRGREDKILTLADRINNCIERPHNGKPLPPNSNELLAMECYIKWLGQNVPTNTRVIGDDGIDIAFMDRPASVENGATIYKKECASCHGIDGEGKMKFNNVSYEYPPLWGKYAYQPGSSMHRVLKAARFIKANMPYGTTWDKPKLSDEDAIDVAAFINDNSHQRPITKRLINYPNIKTKPIDYDQAPYEDNFTATQHKFGPFQPIVNYHKEHNLPIIF
jgi:thiosulfate dehydrogenase